MIFARMRRPAGPSDTTATAVSSQLVSMPSTVRSLRIVRRWPHPQPGASGAMLTGYRLKERLIRLGRFVGLQHLIGGRLDFEQLDAIAPQIAGIAQHRTAGLLVEQ